LTGRCTRPARSAGGGAERIARRQRWQPARSLPVRRQEIRAVRRHAGPAQCLAGRIGWKDEKKLHGLRAYIGGKIYTKNPRLAQLYLRHKSIKTTEDFYSHFLTLQGAFDFSLVPSAPPVAVVQTSGLAA
jgi:hypothetical protein